MSIVLNFKMHILKIELMIKHFKYLIKIAKNYIPDATT